MVQSSQCLERKALNECDISTTCRGHVRTKSVILGKQSYLSTLLRLIGMEMYKIRRRIMSKVLLSIAIIIAILVFLLFSINTFFVLNAPPESFIPPCPPTNVPSQGQALPNCPPPSTAQVSQLQRNCPAQCLRTTTTTHIIESSHTGCS